ncbi:MAG: aminotransferase class III-fold pyridoxal phosphate-dependent enzyme [Ramlibacter sp.]|nr:aminotransferase class III-fold pyridoxal phosphate-dependent enzyme [Ramlibacter sp.]
MADDLASIVLRIVDHIRRELAHSLGQTPQSIDPERLFVDMGADSMILAETLQDINRRYKVSLSIGEIYETVSTVAKVARYIHDHGQWEPVLRTQAGSAARLAPAAGASVPLPVAQNEALSGGRPMTGDVGAIKDIFRRQLELMERQLSLLGLAPGEPTAPAAAASSPAPDKAAATEPAARAPAERASNDRFSAFSTRIEPDSRKDDKRKLAHIEELGRRQEARAGSSKALAQKYRRALADNRVSAGFRPLLKELVYPIVATRAEGSHIVDIDNNRYIDFTMGFGVHLFGHAPEFIVQPLRSQIDLGMAIGPQSPMAGRVAALIAEFTGHDRVVFCNSGTEATMTAVRLARLAAGRDKIVIFKNSYHGSFDGFLARSAAQGSTRPASPGTPESLVTDTIVLDYCEPSAHAYIEEHHAEIGAVLVEPVQSRAPSLQPGPFLARLREITRNHGIVLIFDEVISGFRCARGGAQEYFGVRADLCAYGKVVGGGMPIGVVAGTAVCMDGIDGGWWQFGDASYPEKPTIFFAGTFSKHPLTMAASLAVLEHLENTDLGFYQRLNETTCALAGRLIKVFEEEGVDVTIEQFSSLFRFASTGNLDLFFYHLLANGIYIWEGRNCFVSTAHTAQDIDQLVATVRTVCKELAPLGLIPVVDEAPRRAGERKEAASPAPGAPGNRIGLSDAQQRFLALDRSRPEGRMANNVCFGFRFNEPVDTALLAAAVDAAIGSHDALGCRLDLVLGVQEMEPCNGFAVERISHTGKLTADIAAQLADREQARPLDLEAGRNLRVQLHEFEHGGAFLCLSLHHLVCDGWSLGVLLKEIAQRFNGLPASRAVPYAAWIAQENDYRTSDRYAADKAYWSEVIEKIGTYQARNSADLEPHSPHAGARPGGRASIAFDTKTTAAIAAQAKRSSTTTFTWLLACVQLFLSRVYRGRVPVIGLPFANRTSRLRDLVGNCVNLPVLLSAHGEGLVFDEVLGSSRAAMNDIMSHSRFPYHEICALYLGQPDPRREMPVEITFNFEPLTEMPVFGSAMPELVTPVNRWIEFDLMFNIFFLKTGMRIELDYNTDLFTADAIYGWLNLLAKIIENETTAAATSELAA